MKPLLLPAKSVASCLWGYCWDERDQSPGEPPSAHPPFAAEEALVASTACRARTNKDPKGPPPTGTATTPDIVYSLLPEQECLEKPEGEPGNGTPTATWMGLGGVNPASGHQIRPSYQCSTDGETAVAEEPKLAPAHTQSYAPLPIVRNVWQSLQEALVPA